MVHFNWVNGVLYRFYLNKAVKKTRQRICVFLEGRDHSHDSLCNMYEYEKEWASLILPWVELPPNKT